jgi:tripartite-type tricarboxylate transporter receptor subunit TctC
MSRRLLGLIASLLLAAAAPAGAQNPPDSRPLTLYIGVGAGGGFDLYARTVARHLGRFLPGNPVIVPKNVPGSAGIQLANELATTLAQDETAIGALDNALYMTQLLETSPNIKFDAAKFNWLGRLAGLPLLLMSWHSAAVKNAADVFTKEMVVGTAGAGTYGYLLLSAVKTVLDAKYKLIAGYTSGAEVRLALERGEIEATASIQWTLMREQQRDWLEEKKVNLLIQLGLDSYPDLTEVPLLLDLAKSPEQRQELTVFLSPAQIGRAYVLPPGIPPARIAMLRQAFTAMSKDPQFLADAAKQHLEIDPRTGEEMQRLIAAIGAMPPATLERARAVMRQSAADK